MRTNLHNIIGVADPTSEIFDERCCVSALVTFKTQTTQKVIQYRCIVIISKSEWDAWDEWDQLEDLVNTKTQDL